jgi:hypothetical protein
LLLAAGPTIRSPLLPASRLLASLAQPKVLWRTTHRRDVCASLSLTHVTAGTSLSMVWSLAGSLKVSVSLGTRCSYALLILLVCCAAHPLLPCVPISLQESGRLPSKSCSQPCWVSHRQHTPVPDPSLTQISACDTAVPKPPMTVMTVMTVMADMQCIFACRSVRVRDQCVRACRITAEAIDGPQWDVAAYPRRAASDCTLFTMALHSLKLQPCSHPSENTCALSLHTVTDPARFRVAAARSGVQWCTHVPSQPILYTLLE